MRWRSPDGGFDRSPLPCGGSGTPVGACRTGGKADSARLAKALSSAGAGLALCASATATAETAAHKGEDKCTLDLGGKHAEGPRVAFKENLVSTWHKKPDAGKTTRSWLLDRLLAVHRG